MIRSITGSISVERDWASVARTPKMSAIHSPMLMAMKISSTTSAACPGVMESPRKDTACARFMTSPSSPGAASSSVVMPAAAFPITPPM